MLCTAQGYTSYFTGNATDVSPQTTFGVCMMGGATEHDNAMRWLLEKANGGDVVVIRSTGSNGYNNYLYSQLGVTVNSVETLVITSAAGATDPYVLNKVANAELIWFAGGDQYNYVSYFKDNALEDLINDHINVKHAPVGGTSAGMAILGGKYFSAQNGSVTSAQALANPYASNVTLGSDDFLEVPFMENVITDTHYDNPDRRGRSVAFLARLKQDLNTNAKAIACNEYVAVCIGDDGIAKVYGDYPNYQEFAYFIMDNCTNTNGVENCMPGSPLTWNNNGQALKVYKVPGTMNGTNFYDVNDWYAGVGSGGSWQDWSAVNGSLVVNTNAAAADCSLGSKSFNKDILIVYPNPFIDHIQISNRAGAKVFIYDNLGRKVYSDNIFIGDIIPTSNLNSGFYILEIIKDGNAERIKVMKK